MGSNQRSSPKRSNRSLLVPIDYKHHQCASDNILYTIKKIEKKPILIKSQGAFKLDQNPSKKLHFNYKTTYKCQYANMLNMLI